MKIWSRFVLGGFILALALSLGVSPAAAAPKKKKKAEPKKVTYSSSTTSVSTHKHYVTGTNLQGRSGLFYGDTSDVAGQREVEGGVNLTYQSFAGGSLIGIPAGLHFGVDEDVEVSVAEGLGIMSGGGHSQTTFDGIVGAKYKIVAQSSHVPDFSLGGNVMCPISPSFGNDVFITPEGTVSYVLPSNGLLLNGDLGVAIGTNGGTYAKLDLGTAYPFSNRIAGIAEIGANQAGSGASIFALGIRAMLGDVKGQLFLGAPLNGGNILLGAGIILASK